MLFSLTGGSSGIKVPAAGASSTTTSGGGGVSRKWTDGGRNVRGNTLSRYTREFCEEILGCVCCLGACARRTAWPVSGFLMVTGEFQPGRPEAGSPGRTTNYLFHDGHGSP